MEFNIKEILGFFPPVENLNVEKGKKGKKGGKKEKASSSKQTQEQLLALVSLLQHLPEALHLVSPAQAGEGELLVETTPSVPIMEIHQLLDIFISHSLNESSVYCYDSHQQRRTRK